MQQAESGDQGKCVLNPPNAILMPIGQDFSGRPQMSVLSFNPVVAAADGCFHGIKIGAKLHSVN